ncbi:hypothetical protein LIER_12451 [Lithospermum erythrorhizon]|uniref:Uncharacterized protein n=1 Tax=Lithospermum erythrorhizon TaxID=34254 RepID=A0AAV3PU89_LITER
MVLSQPLSESFSADGVTTCSESFLDDNYGDLSCSTSQLGDATSVCFSNKNSQCESHLYPVSCKENRDPQFGISSCIANQDKHGIINGKPSPISSSNTDILETFPLDIWLKDWSGMECFVEPLDPPSDLTGDYDSHLRNLLYGQIYHGVASSSQVVNDPHLPSSSLQYLYQQHNSNIRDVESYNDFAIGSASSSICLSKEYKCTMEDTCTHFPETSMVAQTHVNETSRPSCRIKFGSFNSIPIIPSDSSQNLASGTNLLQKLSSTSEDKEHERVLEHSFHLKSEEEFPPLYTTNVGKKMACRY